MNGIARLSLTGLLMVGLAGCGAPPADRKEAEVAPEPGSQEAEETVFDDMIQTQDRARAVEGVLMDSKRDLDTAIDHAEDDAEDAAAE
jgi:hypothetical protein